MKAFILSKKIYFITPALIVIFIITLFSLKNTPGASAQNSCSHNHLCGSAFAENIGAIDLKGVSINPTTGNFSGYGWNENIGWIKFDVGSPGPISGTSTGLAKYNFSTGNVSGWIRACSVFASGCSGSLKGNVFRGGWDGWISLRSGLIATPGGEVGAVAYAQVTPTYGVYFNNVTGLGTGAGPNYAWGGTNSSTDRGAAIVGWVNFSDVTLNMDPIVTLTASPKVIPWDISDPSDPQPPASFPYETTLTWTVANATSCASDSDGNSTWSSSAVINGSQQVTVTKLPQTYFLTCYGIGNNSVQRQTTVDRADEPPTIIPPGPAEFEEF